jgi:hypothetical protein
MELFGRYLFRFVQDNAYGTARGSFNLFIPGELGYGAILTMFQITSAPNWHEVMHMTIHGSGNHWASVFFMVTVILGIMLVHLSAATIYSCMQDLSDAFQQKEDAKKAAGSKADAPLASQTGIGGEDAFDTSIRLANAENQSHSSTQTALFIRPNTPIRLLVQKFVNSPYFTILRMALVAAQMCMLAAEYPIQGPCSETKYLSRQCVFRNPVELYPRLDDALIILHAIEVSIQVLDRGLIMHEGAYLRSMGNVLDLFILFISVVAKSVLHCATANRACEFFLWFRPLRVLRVMHFVHFLRKVLSDTHPSHRSLLFSIPAGRFSPPTTHLRQLAVAFLPQVKLPSLQLAIEAMLGSVVWSFLAFAILVCSLLCFSVLGIFLFKGRLGMCRKSAKVPSAPALCSGPTSQGECGLKPCCQVRDEEIPSFVTEMSGSRHDVTDWLDCQGGAASYWVKPSSHFDDLLSSLLALFQIVTADGWTMVI